jgi:hypothetical protein
MNEWPALGRCAAETGKLAKVRSGAVATVGVEGAKWSFDMYEF